MKNIKNAFTLLSAVAVYIFMGYGCDDGAQKEVSPKLFGYGLQTIEHEGCEYILYKDNGRSAVTMVHKQNCVYCSMQKENINSNADYTITIKNDSLQLKTTDGKTVYSGEFNPDSNSIEQAIINDNL